METNAIVGADKLFVNSLDQQARLESISIQALNQGIEHYMKKDYEKAAFEFQKSINLSPNSTFSEQATQHLAQTYLKLEDVEKAVKAYERGIELNPQSDVLQAAIGNLLFSEDRFDEAVAHYRDAVRLNPTASSNFYSLGQGLLKVDKLDEAEDAFRKVLRLEPDSAHGYFGLGQTYAKMESYDSAIDAFERALQKDAEYYEAYAEIGYALADNGDIDAARDMVDELERLDKDLSEMLDEYIDQIEPPKILFNWGSSTFRSRMSVNTPLAALDAYLETPGASKSFTMKFQFNKAMDRSSVQNILNWSIQRTDSANFAKDYNFGARIPDTEITPPGMPDYVLYDADTRIATLSFSLTQNSTGDGTIDPQHIIFKFNGKDAEGIKIDPDFDEYTGFSGVA